MTTKKDDRTELITAFAAVINTIKVHVPETCTHIVSQCTCNKCLARRIKYDRFVERFSPGLQDE